MDWPDQPELYVTQTPMVNAGAVGFEHPFIVLNSGAVALLIDWAQRHTRVREDTAIGLFFAGTMALGVLFIGLREGYNVDLFGYLFGSILSVSSTDIWIILGLGLGVIGVVLLLFKEFFFMSFDEEMAAVSGLPVDRLYFLLLGLMALTVIVSIKIAGIIMVEALLVIPAGLGAGTTPARSASLRWHPTQAGCARRCASATSCGSASTTAVWSRWT